MGMRRSYALNLVPFIPEIIDQIQTVIDSINSPDQVNKQTLLKTLGQVKTELQSLIKSG